MPAISAIVITHNEERNIGRCLASVAPIAEQIVVVDSKSSDRTVELARKFTPEVHVREWSGYARQKQWALDRCRHEWIFWVDADEEVSVDLREEIRALDFTRDGYRVPRKVWYLGRWIRHCGWYPGYVLRLFRRDRGSFDDRLVHERVKLNGSVAHLSGPLYHYSYRDIAHHLAKMNEFTSLAAEQLYREGRRTSPPELVARSVSRFLRMYTLQRGFLDGAAGLVVSVLGGYYVFLKYAKLYEKQRGFNSASEAGSRNPPPSE